MEQLKFKLNERVFEERRGWGNIVGLDEKRAEIDSYLIVFDNNEHNGTITHTLRTLTKWNGVIRPDEVKGGWADGCDLSNEVKSKPEPSTTVDESGVWVRRFKSGAVRSDDRGRENPAFISPYALKFLAQHFSKNAAFFNSNDSAKNYMKGIEPIDIEGSLARHYIDFGFAMMPNRRENIGPIKQALVEIMANCVMGLHQIGLAEDGEYVELFTKTEYIKKEE